MNGSQPKLYSFSKSNRQNNTVHEDEPQNSNSFVTAQKPLGLEGASNHLASTIHSNTTTIKKRLVVPITMKQLSQLQRQLIKSQTIGSDEEHLRDAAFTTYAIMARIISIEKEMNRYMVVCNDGTPMTQDVILYSNKHQTTQNIDRFLKQGTAAKKYIVEELEFEPSTAEGHPYFKLWVKFAAEARGEENIPLWLIEKVSLVKDYNELAYHCALVMAASHQC